MEITGGGHFIVLAMGIDKLYIHDLYATDGTEIRDTLDIMGCTDVVVTNIYTSFIILNPSAYRIHFYSCRPLI